MKGTIEELWHGNIIPHEDSRTNSKEMKELLGYIARHHEDLEKSLRSKKTIININSCHLLSNNYAPDSYSLGSTVHCNNCSRFANE